MNIVLKAAILTLILICSGPAWSDQIIFSDDFNRPDGAVGNGWIDAPDNVSWTDQTGFAHTNDSLFIQNGRLTTAAYRLATIYRPLDYSMPIRLQVTETPTNGYGGLPNAFGPSYSFFNPGINVYPGPFFGTGETITFARSDGNYANSSVVLTVEGIEVGRLYSTFQYDTSIDIDVTVFSDGHIDGLVSGANGSFSFAFGPQTLTNPGNNFAVLVNPPNNATSHYTFATVDNLIVSTESTASVPEPASLALLGVGLAGLGFSRRRKSVQG